MDTQLVATQMRHRSWMEDYARQQESGLTVKQWCQENGILQKTFYYRLRVLREEACSLMNLEPNKAAVKAGTGIRQSRSAKDSRSFIRDQDQAGQCRDQHLAGCEQRTCAHGTGGDSTCLRKHRSVRYT